jgi:amidase
VSVPDIARAFVPHGHFRIEGAARGPLAGLTFVAKDLYDVAGHSTGAGNPTWLATHPVPDCHAPLVDRLLGAGATLIGKVITDELAYSINGDNVHYGTPVNVNAPGRVPGGSSSGSAAAAAASLCDFALGTDTGGSIRVPASFCGVWGLRPTHGLLPGVGVVPLSPSFDTFGWLASDGAVFERVASMLLPEASAPRAAFLFEDAWALADPEAQPLLQSVATAVARVVGSPRRITIADPDLETWRKTYMTVSAREAWDAHGAWIESARPVFGPAIAQRFALAKNVADADYTLASHERERIAQRVVGALGDGGVAILPSAAGPAPRLDAIAADVDAFRMRTLRITCIAGLARLPQVSIPLRTASGLPFGVSLLGAPRSDRALVALARRVVLELSGEAVRG